MLSKLFFCCWNSVLMFPFVLWELLRFPIEIYFSLLCSFTAVLSPTVWMAYNGDDGNLAVIQEHITCSCSEISPSILMQSTLHFQTNHAPVCSCCLGKYFTSCVDFEGDLCEKQGSSFLSRTCLPTKQAFEPNAFFTLDKMSLFPSCSIASFKI